MGTIQSPRYREIEARLTRDPIIQRMAAEMWADGVRPGDTDFVYEDGGPRFAFMQAANRTYARRGGTDGGHIGAAATAVLEVLDVIAKGMAEGEQ